MPINMQPHFDNVTIVSSIGFQSRDWFVAISSVAQNEFYEDIIHQLKVLQRVATPPTGTTIMNVSDVSLGLIFRLLFNLRQSNGKYIGKNHQSRMEAALTALGSTYPAIVTYNSDLLLFETELETFFIAQSRRNLRGKLGT